jgi:hypothetical protein
MLAKEDAARRMSPQQDTFGHGESTDFKLTMITQDFSYTLTQFIQVVDLGNTRHHRETLSS